MPNGRHSEERAMRADKVTVWTCVGASCRRPLGFLLFVAMFALTSSGCQLFFKRNPDLRLLRQVGEPSFGPAWSPDGKTIYFVAADSSSTILGGGQIMAMSPADSGERLLLDGQYGSVCVSHDGTRLAVTAGIRGVGGGVLLSDASGRLLDTLLLPGGDVVSVRFGTSDDTLYCRSDTGVFRLALASQKVDTVILTHFQTLQDFDVYGDSLLALPGKVYNMLSGRTDSMLTLRQPRFCPSDPTVLLGVAGTGDYLNDLVLVDRKSGSVTHFDASPYYSCDIMDPCWSPDGKSILVSAAELISAGFLGGQMPGTYNLWEFQR